MEANAPEIQRPDTGITEFESKLVDFLFKATKTEELPVERLFDVAKEVAAGLLKGAVTAEVRIVEDFMGTTTFRCISDKYKQGDKVKVIIIKEN